MAQRKYQLKNYFKSHSNSINGVDSYNDYGAKTKNLLIFDSSQVSSQLDTRIVFYLKPT